jgi:tetratricopeptide (TPR) repeat protein
VPATGIAARRADAARGGRAQRAGAALLALATLLVYRDVWRFDAVNFDDAMALGGARRVVGEEPAGAARIVSRLPEAFRYVAGHEYLPVRDLSYVAERLACGAFHAGCQHADNLLLHIATGLLAIALAARLGAGAAAALAAGALFLLHPIQVESVAWIASRKDLLAALFAMLAWHTHERGRRTLSALAFLAAGLSKATVVLLPVALAASSVLIGKARPRDAARRVAPHALVAALVAALQLRSAGEAGMLARASGVDPLAALLLAAKLPFLYARNVLWPSELHLLYAPDIPSASSIGAWVPAVALAGGLALAVRAGAVRARPLVALGLATFLLALAPTLGLVPFQLLMADRYAYLAMAGLGLAAAGCFPAAPAPRPGAARTRRARGLAGCAPLALAIPLALASRREALAWRDSEALWRREVARDPARTEAWANLGEHYLTNGRAGEAADALARAARLRPESHEILTNYALAAARAGRHAEAAAAIDAAIARAPDDPAVRYNAACVRARAGDVDAALANLDAAIRRGFGDEAALREDPDLDALRADPRFAEITRTARATREP